MTPTTDLAAPPFDPSTGRRQGDRAREMRAAEIADGLIRHTWREHMPMRDRINMREIATAAALQALTESEAR